MSNTLRSLRKGCGGRSIRLMAMFFCMIIISVIISLSMGCSYLAYRSSHLHTIGTARSDVLSQIGGYIQSLKSDAYTISDLYWNDYDFNILVRNLNEDSADEFSDYMDELTQQYKISFGRTNMDFYVVYYSIGGGSYCSERVPADYDYMDPEIRIWYKDLYDAQGDIVDVASYKDKFLDINAFSAARCVMAPDGSILGYLMININERWIFDTFSDAIMENSNTYIADDEGNIISSNLEHIVGLHYFNMDNLELLFGDKVYAIVQLPHMKSMFTKYVDSQYHFTVFEETPLRELLRPIAATRNTVLAIAGGVTVLSLFLAWYFSGRITEPIMRLRDMVLQVENGEANVDFALNSYSEINTLSLGIEKMLRRIQELMERERQKEVQKRKMQYLLLQAQINPHFMYNTLFSIKCMVDMKENVRASEMLSAYIHLLRSMLSDPDSKSTVRKQMEDLRQYASLQKFRYGGDFDIVLEYEDAVADCLLPQLLIQPLVENALMHGIIGAEKEAGVITVFVRSQENTMLIQVEDNGIGMTDEQIAAAFEDGAAADKPHIGLKNVSDRIGLYFGSEYGLKIESVYGEGTRIVLTLPLLRNGEDKNHD